MSNPFRDVVGEIIKHMDCCPQVKIEESLRFTGYYWYEANNNHELVFDFEYRYSICVGAKYIKLWSNLSLSIDEADTVGFAHSRYYKDYCKDQCWTCQQVADTDSEIILAAEDAIRKHSYETNPEIIINSLKEVPGIIFA